jgi:hypothetical protein
LIAVQQNPDSLFAARSCGVSDVIVVALLDSAGRGAKKWETKIAETHIWRTDIQGTDTGTSKGTTQIAGGNGALTVGVRAKGAFDGSVGGK